MKILIDICHPAHVHMYKNFIRIMEESGNEILVVARDKDCTLSLLNYYNIPYIKVGKPSDFNYNTYLEWTYRYYKLFKIAIRFKPDICMGMLNPALSQISKMLKSKSIIFTDSEPEAIKIPIADFLTQPFADVIMTLESVKHDYGKKEVRINSFKELAYLHPDYFKPDKEIYNLLNLEKNEKYVILRFVGWNAYHDIQKKGFSNEQKIELINKISDHAKVFISSESELPDKLKTYQIKIPPEKIHDALYYSTLFLGDSQTMATESSIMGVPSIRCNSFVGERDMGNFLELEDKYNLLFNFQCPEDAINKATELLETPNIKRIWQKRRDRIFEDKVNLTNYMINFVEKYWNLTLTLASD